MVSSNRNSWKISEGVLMPEGGSGSTVGNLLPNSSLGEWTWQEGTEVKQLVVYMVLATAQLVFRTDTGFQQTVFKDTG